jgi:hypothetical protein
MQSLGIILVLAAIVIVQRPSGANGENEAVVVEPIE